MAFSKFSADSSSRTFLAILLPVSSFIFLAISSFEEVAFLLLSSSTEEHREALTVFFSFFQQQH